MLGDALRGRRDGVVVATKFWGSSPDYVRHACEESLRRLRIDYLDAQGAIAWLWARRERNLPVPGFRSRAQVEENCRALEFGPLRPEQMAEIEVLLGRSTAEVG